MYLILHKEDLNIYVRALQEGKYIVEIKPLNALKTEREFQKEYFSLLDQIVAFTGEQKYNIHTEFKKERNVETTGNFTLEDWITFIDALKWSYFKKLDLIL